MGQVATKCLHHFHLLFGLHTLGNDFKAHCLAQRYHRLYDAGVRLRLRQSLDKRLIDLEGLHRKFCEVTQRRITGTEIVDMNAYPILRQVLQHRPGDRQILQQRGLR